MLSVVYGVPAPEAGDCVMAALQLRADTSFDPERWAEFLAEQPDLGPNAVPRFERIVAAVSHDRDE